MLKTTLIKRMNIIIYIKHPVLGTRVMLPILEKQQADLTNASRYMAARATTPASSDIL